MHVRSSLHAEHDRGRVCLDRCSSIGPWQLFASYWDAIVPDCLSYTHSYSINCFWLVRESDLSHREGLLF